MRSRLHEETKNAVFLYAHLPNKAKLQMTWLVTANRVPQCAESTSAHENQVLPMRNLTINVMQYITAWQD